MVASSFHELTWEALTSRISCLSGTTWLKEAASVFFPCNSTQRQDLVLGPLMWYRPPQ